MRYLSAIFASAFLAACAHDPAAAPTPQASALVTEYSVSVDAALPGQRVTVGEESSFRSNGDGEMVVMVFLEDLPAGVTDLADASGTDSRTLMVGMQPSRDGDGRIVYEIHLAFQDDVEAHPFGLQDRPRLVAAEGETATVHLGQEAGEVYSRLTIDVTSHTVVD
ncbi:hypothetical protein [Maricaulis maris]|uniref:Lipoprotein n=1 Tax=Maricaulis maris TaxID=74318 RepID=A0A495D076_9PROT|nr:hypothetical protein [Maricaulis maris]RKQ94189.1 hypothetical protein C7435_3162 [Maricaulis maris]